MQSDRKYFGWADKYRPTTVKECILPERIKSLFQGYVDDKNIPNLVLAGPPGVGKTSVALAMLDEIDADYIKINSSLKKGIDVIRNEVMDFASSVSFKDGRKYIVFDEGDGMLKASQEALKSFIEEFASNAGFIITCNHKERLDSAYFSRFATIDFNLTKEDLPILGREFLISVFTILDQENVTYDKKVVAEVVKKYYPDWRKTLVELHAYSVKAKTIDTGILSISSEESVDDIIDLLKSKNWNGMRKWVGENYNSVNDFNAFARRLLNGVRLKVQISCLPSFVVLYNEYDYKQAFVIDKEINTVAFLTQIMSEMVWKE